MGAVSAADAVACDACAGALSTVAATIANGIDDLIIVPLAASLRAAMLLENVSRTQRERRTYACAHFRRRRELSSTAPRFQAVWGNRQRRLRGRLTIAASWLALLSAAGAFLASCASLDVGEPLEPPPIVSRHRALSAAESERLLNSALAEFRDDAAVRQLIDAVRARASTPLTAGNRVTILLDGPQTFDAIRKAVSAAKHHVHVETFIYDDDELGREFAELLMTKRREGVQVRVLYDSIGSRSTKSEFFDELRAAGVEVREFRPLNPIKTPLFWKIQNRDHRKIIVVDGAVGFTGGVNISGTYASSSASRPGPERGERMAGAIRILRSKGPPSPGCRSCSSKCGRERAPPMGRTRRRISAAMPIFFRRLR